MKDENDILLDNERYDDEINFEGQLEFNSEEDARDYFNETEGVLSDDVDFEDARFERWWEDNNILIRD